VGEIGVVDMWKTLRSTCKFKCVYNNNNQLSIAVVAVHGRERLQAEFPPRQNPGASSRQGFVDGFGATL
jgi:hypothetical protein